MGSRRKFLQQACWLPLLFPLNKGAAAFPGWPAEKQVDGPASAIFLSTWNFGMRANTAATEVLEKGGTTLDAVEAGVKVIEADPQITTVGIGGTPDRTGRVTLDACIMDHQMNCGSVCALEEIVHPVSVARKVMEETPHVILAGAGALEFAQSQGFKRTKLLTKEAHERWLNWKKDQKYAPVINIENHDTIGMLGMDRNGVLAGACTTSGVGYKMRGRVGDSPIIGAGLYVDGAVGGAVATGLGELMLKNLTAFLVVEFMRAGYPAQEACEKAIQRIIEKNDVRDVQVGVLAISRDGQTGASGLRKGFTYAESRDGKNILKDAPFLVT